MRELALTWKWPPMNSKAAGSCALSEVVPELRRVTIWVSASLV